MHKFIILIFPIILASCSMFEHRDFSQEMGFGQLEYLDEPSFMANRDFMVVAGDDGRDFRSLSEINNRTPASALSREEAMYQQSLKRELFALENSLSEEEYSDYMRYRGSLGSISEHIYFLKLNPRSRADYLRSKGLRAKNSANTMSYERPAAIPADVTLGMRKSDIAKSWGQPRFKEYAGDPNEQNERWIYSQGGVTRLIYFEDGQVAGWETQ
jgi:hypothetical protein